ncbi:hypothetical protein LPJ66_011584, partial [Kickxella alabastrina]
MADHIDQIHEEEEEYDGKLVDGSKHGEYIVDQEDESLAQEVSYEAEEYGEFELAEVEGMEQQGDSTGQAEYASGSILVTTNEGDQMMDEHQGEYYEEDIDKGMDDHQILEHMTQQQQKQHQQLQ